MKKSSMLLIVAMLVLSSCGSTAQLASSDKEQKFQDGIYNSSPSLRTKTEKAEEQTATDALIEKTKASEIYLLGEKKDTIMIPENFSAQIQYDQKLGGTVITVGENPYDWRYDLENNYGYYYGPYSIGASWYWSRHYNPWYWDAWSYHSPWRFNRWHYHSTWYYDPWYYGGFYGGWDPWFGYYNHPYYCGWYGGLGWHPHHHGHFHGHGHHHPGHNPPHIGGPSGKNHYRGQRYQTGSQRLTSGTGTSLRGGTGVRSSVSRSSSTVSVPANGSSNRGTSVSNTGRTIVNRTTATKVNSSSSSSKGNAVKPGTGTSVTRTAPPSYRKPTESKSNAGTNSSTNNSGQSYRSSSSQNSSSTPTRSQSSSSYQRSSSSTGRSATSSSSTSYNRSSSSSSYSRSSSGSGYTRSSSSSGYRR